MKCLWQTRVNLELNVCTIYHSSYFLLLIKNVFITYIITKVT